MLLKTSGEVDLMAEANRIVLEVIAAVGERVAPGVSTAELDHLAYDLIRQAGAAPAFLHYRGYPATLCTSVNDVIVHGIPSQQLLLAEGDIISIDCGVLYEGYYGDAAKTFAVGSIAPQARDLLETTQRSLELALEQVRPGAHLSDIGHAVQSYVEPRGFSVVREFVGHGIGTHLHEDPQVPNYGEPGKGPRLKPGMVIAIEPMVNAGGPEVRIDADGWTARTADGSLSAHFEYSVAVTGDGCRVLGRVADTVSSEA